MVAQVELPPVIGVGCSVIVGIDRWELLSRSLSGLIEMARSCCISCRCLLGPDASLSSHPLIVISERAVTE